MTHRVLVTGASGLIGQKLLAALTEQRQQVEHLVALDVRAPARRLDGVEYVSLDIRAPELEGVLGEHRVNAVVHLAAVVAPGGLTRQQMHDIDVTGTRNVLDACTAQGVAQIVVTSSGAAYGYHHDNPDSLSEDDPLRGNPEFAYSDHKRLVEEMLAEYRQRHPELQQLVFRPGTVLGKGSHSAVSALFERRVIVGVRGASSPFTFMLDDEVAAVLARGVLQAHTGIYNLTADGAVSLRAIAASMGKRYLALPASVLRTAITVLRQLRLVRYGAEQVVFLQHRPVMSNARLKREFGYTPRHSSHQVFDIWRRSHGYGTH